MRTRADMNFSPHIADLLGDTRQSNHESVLGEKFLLPPFSVLNAREGWWQERKRAWLALGIQSELGRGDTDEGALTWGNSPEVTQKGLNFYRNKNKARCFGQDIMRGEWK